MPSKDIRVGLLAYGAIGDEHNSAIRATEGMTLAAVCDTKPERLEAVVTLAFAYQPDVPQGLAERQI